VFHDEVESVRQAVSDIQAEDQDVKIIIAVGHSGFAIDKEIARQVEGVDIVVGGHTNTFLYTGHYLLSYRDKLAEWVEGEGGGWRVDGGGGGWRLEEWMATCLELIMRCNMLLHCNLSTIYFSRASLQCFRLTIH